MNAVSKHGKARAARKGQPPFDLSDADNGRWESRELGASDEHAIVADVAALASLDEAVGSQLISIRLPKKLLALLKAIAGVHGIGYQPMVRDVLSRWAAGELESLIDQVQKLERMAKPDVVDPVLPSRKVANG